MPHTFAKLLLVGFAAVASHGQNTTANPPTPSTLQQPKPEAVPKRAPLPPSPPDAPMPDPGSLPVPPDKTRSPVRRVLDRLDPNCGDWIFHTCWSSPKETEARDPEAQGFAKNFEAGDVYFKSKNYQGAASRFREALEYKPDSGEAIFKLAVSLDKLGQTDEACDAYEAYLRLLPDGPRAKAARPAVERIKRSASARQPAK